MLAHICMQRFPYIPAHIVRQYSPSVVQRNRLHLKENTHPSLPLLLTLLLVVLHNCSLFRLLQQRPVALFKALRRAEQMVMSIRIQNSHTQRHHYFHVLCRELVVIQGVVVTTASHIAPMIRQHKVRIVFDSLYVIQLAKLLQLFEAFANQCTHSKRGVHQHTQRCICLLQHVHRWESTVAGIKSASVFTSGSFDDRGPCGVQVYSHYRLEIWSLDPTIMYAHFRPETSQSFGNYTCN